MNTMKIYIGCAINKSDDQVWQIVDTLKERLANQGHELLNFVGTDPKVTAQTVYHTDLACTNEADLMIAIADAPSTGLGMEIQNRIHLKKPTLICHRPEVKISRMVLGAAATYDFMSVVAYQDEDDILAAIK